MRPNKNQISPFSLFAENETTVCDDLTLTRLLALLDSPYLTDPIMPPVGRIAITQDRCFLLSMDELARNSANPVVKYVKLVQKAGKWVPQHTLDKSGWPIGVMLPYYSKLVSYQSSDGAVGLGYRHHESDKVWYYRPERGPAGLLHGIVHVEDGPHMYRRAVRGLHPRHHRKEPA